MKEINPRVTSWGKIYYLFMINPKFSVAKKQDKLRKKVFFILRTLAQNCL